MFVTGDQCKWRLPTPPSGAQIAKGARIDHQFASEIGHGQPIFGQLFSMNPAMNAVDFTTFRI